MPKKYERNSALEKIYTIFQSRRLIMQDKIQSVAGAEEEHFASTEA